MSWENIDPYRAIQLMGSADMATWRQNMQSLHDGNGTTFHHPGTGANYTVFGNIGQDIDPVNMRLPLVTRGGLVMGAFYGQFLSVVSSSIRVSIIREDPISHLGRNLFVDFDAEIWANASPGGFRGWLKPFPNLPAGTHTFSMAWGINPAGTALLLVGYRPRFSVWEWK